MHVHRYSHIIPTVIKTNTSLAWNEHRGKLFCPLCWKITGPNHFEFCKLNKWTRCYRTMNYRGIIFCYVKTYNTFNCVALSLEWELITTLFRIHWKLTLKISLHYLINIYNHSISMIFLLGWRGMAIYFVEI